MEEKTGTETWRNVKRSINDILRSTIFSVHVLIIRELFYVVCILCVK